MRSKDILNVYQIISCACCKCSGFPLFRIAKVGNVRPFPQEKANLGWFRTTEEQRNYPLLFCNKLFYSCRVLDEGLVLILVPLYPKSVHSLLFTRTCVSLSLALHTYGVAEHPHQCFLNALSGIEGLRNFPFMMLILRVGTSDICISKRLCQSPYDY